MSLSNKKIIVVLFLLIMALAVFFRFYKLDQIPPALYPDVAINGINAIDANSTGDYKIFYPDNNGREGLFMNLIAFSFLIFGPSVWAMKIVAALFGIFTVLGTYLLTKQLFHYINPPKAELSSGQPSPVSSTGQALKGESYYPPLGGARGDFFLPHSEIIALLSAFFVAISFWHVNFSRIGFRAIMVPFFLVWSLYFLFKGINSDPNIQIHLNNPNKKSRLAIGYWLLAGLFFGLGFHTYIAFRIAPLVLIPIFIIEIAKNWPRLKLGRWIIFAIFMVAAASPLAYYYLTHPADFMGRAGQVSIFASKNPIQTLISSTLKTFGQFVFRGDLNWRHNLSGSPEVFWPLIPFFLIGFFYSLIQLLKRKGYARDSLALISCHWTLMVSWGAMLIPSIATNEGVPHALRSIGAAPFTFIFAGLGMFLVIKKLKLGNFKLGIAFVFAFFIILTYFSFRMYFIDWAQNPNVPGAFTQNYFDEATYLNSLPPAVQKYVFVNEDGVAVPYPDGIPMPSQTIKFITLENPDIIYYKQSQLNQMLNDSYYLPTVIVPMRNDQNIFNALKSKFPNGQIESRENFSIFKINY